MRQPFWKKYGVWLLIISGLMTALPLLFNEIGFIQWISIIPAALVLTGMASDESIGLGRIYLAGLIFFESYFLVVFHWFIAMYPLEFTGISRGAAIFVVALAWIGLSLLSAALYALSAIALAVIARMELLGDVAKGIVMPIAAASLWVVFEWIQTLDWWGVPWGRLCLGQVNTPSFIASASIFGSYFVSFVIVAVNFYLAYSIIQAKKRRIACAICALAIFLLNLSLSAGALLTYEDGKETVCVAAVQGNNPNSDIWVDGTLEKVLTTHEKLTRKAVNNGADIVLWSETAFPYDYFKHEYLKDRISDLAIDTGAVILVSAFTSTVEGNMQVSLIQVKPDGSYGEVMYHKQRLVPFGEFIPMGGLLEKLIPPLANLYTREETLIAGRENTVIETEYAKIGSAICYDSIFEEILRGAANNEAELLVVSTNDSWFGLSKALDMHNAQAILRSVETGRYVVRSANTGISSIISPRGEVLQDLGGGVTGYVIDDVHLNNHTTPYMTWGNLFVYLCLAFCAALPLINAAKYLLNVKSFNQK